MKEVFGKETQSKVLERLKEYTDFKYMNYVLVLTKIISYKTTKIK